MFILRKITGNGGELNFALGDSYSLILKESQPKEFKEVLYVNGHNAFMDDIYGFIGYGDSKFHMLFISHFNYIMTENGKTFKNVTSHEKTYAYNRELADGEKHFEKVRHIHEEIAGKPYPPKETKLSDHFSKLMCQQLKRSLDLYTTEEANKLTDDELLKVPGFGKIALQKLRRISNQQNS